MTVLGLKQSCLGVSHFRVAGKSQELVHSGRFWVRKTLMACLTARIQSTRTIGACFQLDQGLEKDSGQP